MKTLINNIKTFFETAITGGTLSATTVFKGLQNAPQQSAYNQYPYIMIDDGGERTEGTGATGSQVRYYRVIIEIGCFSLKNVSEAMDQIFDLSTQVRNILGLEANRQKDGFIWGISITPFAWDEERYFFRGRQIIAEYFEVEERIDEY